MSLASIRVLTVDPHPLVQEGLATVINREPGMSVVAAAASGAAALTRIRECRPDVLTFDLLLPDMPGDEFARRLRDAFPEVRLVAVTAVRGDVHLLRALAAGVLGYASKDTPPRELLDVIRKVHAGKKIIPAHIAASLAEHFGDESLTPREIQVLQLVARGNRNKEVAAHLRIADETVRMHMKHILGKLSANDRTHAVTIAVSRGVFQLDIPSFA